MMKLLLFSFTLGLSAFGFSQTCTPIFDFGSEPYGVNPDTVENFMGGSVNNIYFQQIDVKVPANGAAFGLDFVNVDSARIASLTNLPPGLTITCMQNATAPCTYLGGTVGCAFISGIPTSPGTYELGVFLELYTSFSQAPFPLEFPGYRIIIDDVTGLDYADRLTMEMLETRPNPANDKAFVDIASNNNGAASFRVFDMVGKQVFQKNVVLTQGKNQISYNTSALPEGIYILRVDAFEETLTSRLVVVH